jgi:hypothetical protein
MRRQHLVPESLLFATACFAPEDHAHDLPPVSGGRSGDPEDPSSGSQPDETTGIDPQGSGEESESGHDTEPSSDTEEDPTTGADAMAPSVVEYSPADAATGIHGDASIVLTFSEPMDREPTQAAWQSPDIDGRPLRPTAVAGRAARSTSRASACPSPISSSSSFRCAINVVAATFVERAALETHMDVPGVARRMSDDPG